MNAKTMKSIIALAMTCVMIFAFAGCGGGASEKNEDEITVGVLVPLTEAEAYYGKDMLQSYQLAVDEINAAGGILGKQLKLYEADDKCDPAEAVKAANKIISQNVDFVVGGYGSGATIPALQLFKDNGLMMLISCANSTKITEEGHNQTFMLNSPGTHAVITLTELLRSLGSKKVALIHQGDAYTQNLSDICKEELPKSGFEIAAVEMMEKGAPDVSAIVTSIKNSGADFVYWCGYHADGSNVIKQLRQGGYEGDIAVGDGSASPELITACGAAGEGIYVTSPPYVEFAEGGQKFVDAYKEKFNMEPGTYATLCYDTMYVLKNAIEKAGTIEMEKVRDKVQEIEYAGLSGTIKFTDDRELAVSNFIILQIKEGKFELVTTE